MICKMSKMSLKNKVTHHKSCIYLIRTRLVSHNVETLQVQNKFLYMAQVHRTSHG